MGLAPTDTVQISGHKNRQNVNSYAKLNNQQQKKIATPLVNTDSNTEVPLNKCNSPVLAAATPHHSHVPVNQLDSPINPNSYMGGSGSATIKKT